MIPISSTRGTWVRYVGLGIGLVMAGAGLVYAALALSQVKMVATKPSRDTDRNHYVGKVTSDRQPIVGATVRSKAQPYSAKTDRVGEFRLVRSGGDPIVVTAWKSGFFIGQEAFQTNPIEIQLRPLPEKDYVNYEWVAPTVDPSQKQQCGNCHQEILDEWKESGHSQAATNRRFMNLYEGTDWHGHGPKGWSLRDEYPLGVGVCASCHAPTIADHGESTDMRSISGTTSHGVHCDFCHKVQDVAVANLGRTHGRDAITLLRPEKGQLFFGPLDDATRGEEAYSPLQKESRFCAACHEGVVFGVHVYSTYSEWKKSPAAVVGKSCQSCHMTPTGKMTNIAPGVGGMERAPQSLASHSFMPGGREAMLKRCLNVEVIAQQRDRQVAIDVRITPENVGHRVPTGFIDRHLILTVEPLSRTGARINLPLGIDKRNVVDSLEELANLPGRFFGRLLKDEQGQSPAPFWRSNSEVIDSRLSPDVTTTTKFVFPPDTAQVHVRLLYRRFWSEVARAKQWPDETIVVFDKLISIELDKSTKNQTERGQP